MTPDGHGHTRTHLEESFWVSHMRVGFAVFAAESVAVLAYLLASPDGAYRGVLVPIAAASAGLASLSLLAVGRIARQPWKAKFSLAWALGGGWLLALCAHLDGGLDSPLLYLVLFPVIYAAVGYGPAAVMACGVSALAQMMVIAANDGVVAVAGEKLLMVAAVVGGVSVLAITSSVNRAEMQRNESLLVRKLALLADTDGLTGCLTHRAFHERLSAEIDRAVRYDRPLCLIVADIDDFKAVNDTYGHQVGDRALAAVGRVLRTEVRSADVVGRIGGDEFGIVLADTPLDGAQIHARRIGLRLDEQPAPGIALSIGIALLDPANPTSSQLLKDADRALYHVKRTGRNGIAAATSSAAPTRLAS